jgi:hypothetical protein
MFRQYVSPGELFCYIGYIFGHGKGTWNRMRYQSHFTIRLKKNTGLAPTAFRSTGRVEDG